MRPLFSLFSPRDVHPIARANIPALRSRLPLYVKTKPIPVVFVLAIMEIEAWFMAEHTHFERLDARLTPAQIKAHFGFDPSTEDMEQRNRPAMDMDMIYSLVSHRYQKDRTVLQGTVSLLDFARFYLELPSRYSELKLLVASVDGFLSLA
jgi:hypothetical protein